MQKLVIALIACLALSMSACSHLGHGGGDCQAHKSATMTNCPGGEDCKRCPSVAASDCSCPEGGCTCPQEERVKKCCSECACGENSEGTCRDDCKHGSSAGRCGRGS